MLLPIKIGALWLLANGHAVMGCQLIIAAKLVGTALVARIFTLTRPQLMTLAWFAFIYNTIMRWRAVLYGWGDRPRAPGSGSKPCVPACAPGVSRWKPGRIGMRLRAIQRHKRRAAFR